MDGHMGRVFSLKYHPSDTRMLVSAGWDDTVQFWDTRSKHSVRYTTRAGECRALLYLQQLWNG